ncbi:3-oxoacyl-[acyl-carrier protein] reductase [Panacagrimonas perspica]|uniref:3-oxoacyl-[acyl-carrier protein] reductase n=1 Tax=Panacagrimonas perspica TaxID=381431 RepID=A0A4R7PAR7_9GAMM|nr:SDR family oxidoreductase [Panacagrimonas perspica]TDU31047.1 3-oxoacyl-[acyl-carrier protein] reductase [Panacagrimonas perspica]THD01809.1 3-oxoacyl-ACP reductase [Panacagrimonas perspica]
MDLDFSGKSALVVGGSSGIGNGIARAFLARGASVEVWGTRATAADYAGTEGSDLDGLAYRSVDVSQSGAIEAAPVPERLDVLVLAQGTVLYERREFAMEGFRKVMEVNLMSLMACAAKYETALAAARGTVIVIGSIASIRATKGNPAYSASKSGALGLTRTLAEAWAPRGIRVNGIAPGFVETKLTDVTTQNPKRRAAALAGIPAGRFGSVEEMAGVALFLASPLSAYVTGQMIVADGGMSLS